MPLIYLIISDNIVEADPFQQDQTKGEEQKLRLVVVEESTFHKVLRGCSLSRADNSWLHSINRTIRTHRNLTADTAPLPPMTHEQPERMPDNNKLDNGCGTHFRFGSSRLIPSAQIFAYIHSKSESDCRVNFMTSIRKRQGSKANS
uniref:AlNc14C159G7740 protein n=2 Tax=Albugo laibachii Nc14 TaxID=890382 RepID=F0WMQ5_9STRA|nr:AlNc14C159G7740 [Albugo laibachii Nc14]|eukprot:CCA22589.1 AlNc14C159G7740 [Albugo laibachii Nc14]